MKKVVSLILVVTLLAAVGSLLTGCGDETSKDVKKFTVFGFSSEADTKKKEVYDYYQKKWEANADRPIEWIGGDLSMIMASGDYPDIIMGALFQNVDVAKYAEQEVLVPMDEYITEENTPNIWNMFTNHPTTKAIATSPDGHIYALPSYGGSPETFLETYWWINRQWLDKLGLEVPSTLPELKEVLRAFKNGDPNGNGKADEIPMTFFNEGAANYPETILSCWGVSTKFGMYDGYLNVQDGKVNFAPMMDEWKEMIKFYAELYKEGLLDVQCFTYEHNTYSSTIKSETPVVGVAFGGSTEMATHADQYEVIPPLSADGNIRPVMHIHPGAVGTRNLAFVTANCEDPKAALAWLDTFFSKEATLINQYGEVEGADLGNVKPSFYLEDGMYKWKDPAEQGYNSISEMYYGNTPKGPHILGYMNRQEDRGVFVEDMENWQALDKLWAMYEPYTDKETWPRPYYLPDDSSRLSVLQTDIFNHVEKNKADWIMGRSDVEEDWDEYLARLNEMGAEEYLEINQRTYDVYQKTVDEIVGK